MLSFCYSSTHLFSIRSTEPVFAALDGVQECIVGYTGGVADGVTYHNMGDYTEALWIRYDTQRTNLPNILQAWQDMAMPYPTKRQYRTALWYTNDAQKQEMQAFVEALQKEGYSGVEHIDLEPATQFFRAEEYHQNFLAKQ